MSAPVFTPGPWLVVPYGDGDSLVIHDARGDWRVCFMATPGSSGDMRGIAANAHLIASAPTMFEALNKYADDLCEGWCERSADCAHFDDCAGCLARRTAYAATVRSGEQP